jgi:hypothetical protein
VLGPASRRVAELVGYQGFVPAPGNATASPDGTVVGIHPERVVAGAQRGRGVVLTGIISACRPAGAGWEADLAIGAATITCRLPERPAVPGAEMVVTALDPPWFGPSGAAITPPGGASTAGGPAGQDQVTR